MRKGVDLTLVRRSLLWTLYQYSKLSVDTKAERRIRGWKEGDESAIAKCIADIREIWSAKKFEWHNDGRTEAQKPDFRKIKEEYFANKGYDPETRNLFSSVVSTFINFERKGIKRETADILRRFELGFRMILCPNEEVLY